MRFLVCLPVFCASLTPNRHNYERGTFEFLEPLLCAAQHYCLRNNGCELILADIYGARASVATETNQPNSALENFRLQYKALGRAVELGMITLPDIRFCFGLGGMANGTHAMGFYEEAEQWYRKCFEAFKGLDADKRMYVSVPDTLDSCSPPRVPPTRRSHQTVRVET